MRNLANFQLTTRESQLERNSIVSKTRESQKITEELCVMTLNNDAKFKEWPTSHCKNDMKNLVNFHGSTWKSQNLYFDGVPMSKEYKVLTKKLQRSYVSCHWTVVQNLMKNLYLLLQKWNKEFGKFLCKHSNVSKLVLWWVTFIQSILMDERKN